MEFIIVTGLSGGGKSRAINALEDIGYYCVDNMPPKLITKFAELCAQSKETISKVAMVTDTRSRDHFSGIYDTLNEIEAQKINYKILFLEASDAVLVRRYKETRRKHPLADSVPGSLENCIRHERELLIPLRAKADYVIDTSLISPAQLKESVVKLFLGDLSAGMLVRCLSFGFKYGNPTEADLMFDVRCLPNPFYQDELKNLTGLDKQVHDYVMQWPQSGDYLNRLYDLIDYLLPLYVNEGKSQLVVAIGCTGGKHRSVTFAELIYKRLQQQGQRVSVSHRDIQKQ